MACRSRRQLEWLSVTRGSDVSSPAKQWIAGIRSIPILQLFQHIGLRGFARQLHNLPLMMGGAGRIGRLSHTANQP